MCKKSSYEEELKTPLRICFISSTTNKSADPNDWVNLVSNLFRQDRSNNPKENTIDLSQGTSYRFFISGDLK